MGTTHPLPVGLSLKKALRLDDFLFFLNQKLVATIRTIRLATQSLSFRRECTELVGVKAESTFSPDLQSGEPSKSWKTSSETLKRSAYEIRERKNGLVEIMAIMTVNDGSCCLFVRASTSSDESNECLPSIVKVFYEFKYLAERLLLS